MDVVLGLVASGTRPARPRLGQDFYGIRDCGASFFSPLFLDEQKKRLVRVLVIGYEKLIALAYETLTLPVANLPWNKAKK